VFAVIKKWLQITGSHPPTMRFHPNSPYAAEFARLKDKVVKENPGVPPTEIVRKIMDEIERSGKFSAE
jgi:hypothetical protein